MALAFRSPVLVRLVPFTSPAPRAGEFRVTQRFADIDYYWAARDRAAGRRPRTHQAADIGNFRCNDPIVAMAGGTAYRIHDNARALGAASDALGIRIEHGQGVATSYWHLNSQAVASGTRVRAGQRIGNLGSTGLGAVCHCHIEMTVNGAKVDPEPFMFGATWPRSKIATAPPKGDPMIDFIPEAWTVGPAGAVIYAAVNGAAAGHTLKAGESITTIGEPVNDRDWRLVLAQPKGWPRRGGWVKRKDLVAIGRNAPFEAAVWKLLLSRKAP